jgi:transcriptional regulatory protein GAL4
MDDWTLPQTRSNCQGPTSGVVFLRSLLFWIGNPALLTHSSLRPPEMSGQSPEYLTGSLDFSETSLSRQITNQLIEAYFSNYHPSYPFVHEATFRAQHHEVIPRPQAASWNILFCTVLALGSWTSGHERTDLDDLLYRRATMLARDESLFETANLTIVQALVLLSNLSQKRNRPNTGWNFLGLATRMALSLGLHCEHPGWNVSVLQQEMRRRVWWGLFLFDSGASTTFGRVILLPDGDTMDVKSVLNIDDEGRIM